MVPVWDLCDPTLNPLQGRLAQNEQTWERTMGTCLLSSFVEIHDVVLEIKKLNLWYSKHAHTPFLFVVLKNQLKVTKNIFWKNHLTKASIALLKQLPIKHIKLMHQDQPQGGGIQCYLMKFNENDLKLIVQKEVQNASKIKFPMFTKMTK